MPDDSDSEDADRWIPPPPLPYIPEIELRLGEPRYGWLPFYLGFGEFELSIRASNVMNDPIEELIDLGPFLHDGRSGFRRVCLWLEPAGYAIDLRSIDDDRVMLQIWFDKCFCPPMSAHAMDQTFVCVTDRRLLLRKLKLNITRWLSDHQFHLPTHWNKSSDYYDCFLPRLSQRKRRT